MATDIETAENEVPECDFCPSTDVRPYYPDAGGEQEGLTCPACAARHHLWFSPKRRCEATCDNEAEAEVFYDDHGVEAYVCASCAEFNGVSHTHPDDREVEEDDEDDGLCGYCGGSGGGDDVAACRMCSGTGYAGGRRRRGGDEEPPDRDDDYDYWR